MEQLHLNLRTLLQGPLQVEHFRDGAAFHVKDLDFGVGDPDGEGKDLRPDAGAGGSKIEFRLADLQGGAGGEMKAHFHVLDIAGELDLLLGQEGGA